jgi:hypothetical protein
MLTLCPAPPPASAPPAEFKDEEKLIPNNTRVLVKKLNAKAQIAELNDAKTCVESLDLPCAVVLVFDVAFVMNIRLHLSAAPARMARDPKLPKPPLFPALACTLLRAPRSHPLVYRPTPCEFSATYAPGSRKCCALARGRALFSHSSSGPFLQFTRDCREPRDSIVRDGKSSFLTLR